MKTKSKIITIKDIDIFYREAGTHNKETILLLHGFPSSSHMFRNIIELLADKYHLIAPDYPGFGLSAAPSQEDFEYTFDNVTALMDAFIDALNLSSLYLLLQDYGGPIGFRIATKRPLLIKGLIIQNANAYIEGLGEWAQKIGRYQAANNMEDLNTYKDYLMSAEGIKKQYTEGTETVAKISPISYLTDIAFMNRKGIQDIQTAMFFNYGTNFPKYEEWQNYFRTQQPKTLIVWGENDKFFNKTGGLSYSKDLKNIKSYFYNGGHFILEEYAVEVAENIKQFIN